ncbi:RNA 2',3'-cyclic phosphodiesterase [Enterovibrio norvegicus]|uniref:RNA 2',3'-cyclic phosphodiesterase n=1 Tax=Enterovibrio norvegicus TaxID=188144 RepID=UPI000C848AB3|nr:RNA 2',3'-cyclic phosphodiesterase [Enterovibrio norvegicus]PMN68545.1 2'-5' RNA ligase [Enterovibrio norvegicus]
MERTRRLFFALDFSTPENAQAKAEIIRLKHTLSPLGQPVPNDNLHLTLAFLGNVSQQDYLALCRAADKIDASAFSLRTASLGYFNKPQILWLGIHPSDELQRLAETINTLSRAVLNIDKGDTPNTPNFLPHISLLRQVEPGAIDTISDAYKEGESSSLTVQRFGLYQSAPHPTHKGVQYTCLNTWPLSIAKPTPKSDFPSYSLKDDHEL